MRSLGSRAVALSSLLCLTAASLLLSGCAASFTNNASLAAQGAQMAGKIHGGNQPVTGSQIYLYAAGTGGYGTSARSMLGGSGYVTTDGSGSFAIAASDYTCQTGDQVYLLALGGNPGMSDGTNNTALALMAALGPCDQLGSIPFVDVDEVTTVAAAYALAGFMTSTTQLSSSATSLAHIGVVNAFRTASNLANFSSGAANATTPAGNGIVPQAEINSLANALAACVNTDGDTTSGTPCATLFGAATPSGGSAPGDTVQAALNIAHNPGIGVGAIYTLGASSAPFQPTLSTAPNDWSLAVAYNSNGPGLEADGYAVAVDGNGNVWAATENSVLELDPTGALLSPADGYSLGIGDPYTSVAGVAIDSSNNAWISVNNASTLSDSRVVKFGSNGSILSPAGGFSGGGLTTTASASAAFDSTGNLWVAADGGPTISVLNSAGNAVSPSTGYLLSGAPFYAGVTPFANTSGDMWAYNTEFAGNGTALVLGTQCASGYNSTTAVDHEGHLWAGNGDGLFECDANGNQLNGGAEYSFGGTVSDAFDVQIDGTDRPWAVTEGGVVAALNNDGSLVSPVNGYQSDAINSNDGANYFALDGSGNLWVASDGQAVVEFVGIASPVVTPMATAVATNTLGTRP